MNLLLKHYRNINKNSILFSSAVNLPKSRYDYLQKKSIAPEVAKLCDQHKDAILYSSYIEDSKLKLGWVKNKIVKNMIKKEEQRKLDENINIKPFSLALKYLHEDQSIGSKTERSTGILTDEYREDLKQHREKSPEVQNNKYQNSPETSEYESSINYWMHDYETYDENLNEENEEVGSRFGTSDPTIPISKVPCYGCGAFLHCADSSLPGYLPSEIFRDQKKEVLMTMTCQRCHFLLKYNTAINITVNPQEYIKMISSIEDKYALAILMIDLMDFPCSIWPDITKILGTKRPVFIVGNKVDLLPKDSKGYLQHILRCLEKSVIETGIDKTNIKHTCLISAETGYGVEELINKLHNIWHYKGDVYLVGCTNVGKSSLFNALLRSDYCKVKASNIIKKATASPWPGTTIRMLKFPILRPSDMRLYIRTQRLMSERAQRVAEQKLRKDQALTTGKSEYATLMAHIGKSYVKSPEEVQDGFSLGKGIPLFESIKEDSKEYAKSKWCFDTPGVVQPEQILNLLTTEELLLTIPKEMIRPRTFLLKPNMSLFLAGLGRIDYVDALMTQKPGDEGIRLTVYASMALPILITKTNEAANIYDTFLGTEMLGVPIGDEDRLKNWPKLEKSELITVEGKGEDLTVCDILLSSAGWIGINLHNYMQATFLVWTPEKRGIFIRTPALIPYGIKLRGPKIRGSLAYQTGSAFIKQ